MYKRYNYFEILDIINTYSSSAEYLLHKDVWEKTFIPHYFKLILEVFNNLYFMPKKIADIGAGYGFWSLMFAKLGCHVDAIDNLEIRLTCLQQLSLRYPTITPVSTDMRDICIDDAIYDMTFCASVLHVVKDYEKAVLEMLRITKNGGYLFFLITNPNSPHIIQYFKENKILERLQPASKEKISSILYDKATQIVCRSIYSSREIYNLIPEQYILVYKKL